MDVHTTLIFVKFLAERTLIRHVRIEMNVGKMTLEIMHGGDQAFANHAKYATLRLH